MTDLTTACRVSGHKPPRLWAYSLILHVRYWTYAGVVEAHTLYKKNRRAIENQYVYSLLTFFIGLLLIIPNPYLATIAKFLAQHGKLWHWGVVYFLLGRFGMHEVLRGRRLGKCAVQFLILGAWAFLTIISVCTSGLGIGTTVIAFCTWRISSVLGLLIDGE